MLAVAGGKGGCGKTTTVLGLGRAWDGAVVAVDTDRDMPNLHAMAGVNREPTAADIAAGAAPQALESGLSICPAPPPDTPDSSVPTLLSRLDQLTDGTLVVDCPGGAGPDAVAPLSAASSVVLVSSLCAPSLRDTAKTAAMARALDCSVLGVVLTRTRLRPPTVETLLDCPILGSIPAVSAPVLDSERVIEAYTAVAHELPVSRKTRANTGRPS